MKYLRAMNGEKSHASGYMFKINEVNISEIWNENATTPEEQGGFNFTNEENILRWIIRGDTIYDVVIPEDATIVKINNINTPNGVYRTNKIIVKNPQKITDNLCLEYLKVSKMPQKTYFQVLAILAGKGFAKTCLEIISSKINKNNINDCISEYLNFSFYKNNGIYNTILDKLYKIQ